ncbi:hypothetical protein CR969_00985 [Candidatus Saccharibacteria bacterium]|nr:MAG: hypothetical protein CR969_00985 [Candidatus Saccharibacteria bacterium]
MDDVKKAAGSKKNPVYKFINNHKKMSIIIGVILLIMFGYSLGSSSNKSAESKYPEVDVNGMFASEACEKLREKGWTIGSVYKGNEKSDCSNSSDRVTGVSYYDDEASLSLKHDVSKNKKEESKSVKQKSKGKEKQEIKQSRYKVSEDAAEHYCQDAGLLNKYIDTSKISTIYITNYKKRYTDSFTYDVNGNPIWFFQWNGKNKSNNEAVGFSCWVSGKSDDDISLHRLTIGGNIVIGENLKSYNEDGSLVE